jgi:ABC-type transport system substrate-binding protein
MRPIAYQFRAVINFATGGTGSGGRGVPARPSRAKLCGRALVPRLPIRNVLLAAILLTSTISAPAETRPHYGGTLRVMLQSAPDTLNLFSNSTPADYWDMARTLSLIGDTLIKLDAQARPQPALAVAWQSGPDARHWQFTLHRGVKFHDGSAATPAAVAQILGALHPTWIVRASADAVTIDSETPLPSLLAELALPRNLILKRNDNASRVPIGTGAFLVAEWQPGKSLKLAASEQSWAGRPFVDAIEIEFGKSLRDQASALELEKTDIIEVAPQPASGPQRHNASSTSPLPVELMALVFSASSKAQDPRLREALALAIDRKSIQSVLLKGTGEPAAGILPNWMTGYSAVFSAPANPQRVRTLSAESRPPAPNPSAVLTYVLSYDPRDSQAQLIAERIALNAREVGIAVQVSLSGTPDIRLMRVVLPSPDPATSLAEAASQLGLPQPATAFPTGNSLEDLYQSERSLLNGHTVIPLFHLPLQSAVSARVRDWEPDRLGEWNGPGIALADLWLAVPPAANSRSYGPQPEASSQ